MNKSDYVLILFHRLINGEHVSKNLFMNEFKVGRRSFDRYVQTIRLMLSDVYSPNELCYDVKNNEYYLSGISQNKLHGINILPLLLLMFDSNAFKLGDSIKILTELLASVSVNEKIILQNTILRLNSDKSVDDGNSILKLIWDLNLVIDGQEKIILHYEKNSKIFSERVLPKKLSCVSGKWIMEFLTLENEIKNCPLENIIGFEKIKL